MYIFMLKTFKQSLVILSEEKPENTWTLNLVYIGYISEGVSIPDNFKEKILSCLP